MISLLNIMNKEKISNLIDWLLVSIMCICMLIVFILWCNKAEAQSIITRKGNMFIQDTVSKKKTSPVPTEYHYVDSDGIVYTVYVVHYVIKKSSKTGKDYKKYLPELTHQIYENR